MNSSNQAFENHLIKNVPTAVSAKSFTRNEDGSYQDAVVQGYYAFWDAARFDFQTRIDLNIQVKDLNRPIKFKAGCDCGCNAPSFTTPFGALRFLMHRMNSAGVGAAVGVSYAYDIMQILKAHDAVESDAHLSVVSKS